MFIAWDQALQRGKKAKNRGQIVKISANAASTAVVWRWGKGGGACLCLEIRFLKNIFPNSKSVTLKECDTVNMKTFDQSEHGTRFWYQGTATTKACLQALPPFPLPRLPLGSLRSPSFFPFFPHVKPGPRLKCFSHVSMFQLS